MKKKSKESSSTENKTQQKDNHKKSDSSQQKEHQTSKENNRKVMEVQTPMFSRKMKIQIENDPTRAQPNLTRRFKINLRIISTSFRNKISDRFQEIDRLFVCRKTKEQRLNMGVEYEDIKLIDIYTKSNPNKVSQKYGKQLLMNLLFNYQGHPTLKRQVRLNHEYKPPNINPEEEIEEEKLLDEQKLFQSLHEQLQELQKKYNRTTEQISELFVKVCGDLEMVEAALMGKQVPEWSYLEDLALTKQYESTEYQWLLRTKGQKEIEKRRRFLLTAENDCERQDRSGQPSSGQLGDDNDMLAAEDAAQDESVAYV